MWGGDYREYMGIPYSRRKRLLDEKDALEQQRAQNKKQQEASRPKSRMRGRR
jgi:hypothetical protein